MKNKDMFNKQTNYLKNQKKNHLKFLEIKKFLYNDRDVEAEKRKIELIKSKNEIQKLADINEIQKVKGNTMPLEPFLTFVIMKFLIVIIQPRLPRIIFITYFTL